MAGSYDHVTTSKGKLRNPTTYAQLIDNLGDAYEATEEMYGMIWFLANAIAYETVSDAAGIVEEARQAYREGIASSPGVQRG